MGQGVDERRIILPVPIARVRNCLTDYRRALHARIDEATGELIVRYRADPLAALSLIPQE